MPRQSIVRSLLFLVASCAVDPDSADPGPRPPIETHALAVLDARRSELGLDANHSFAVKATIPDELGQTHVRVDQRYKGLPVIGGTATLHLDGAGAERALTDALLRNIDLDVTPRINPEQARAAVEAAIRPTAYLGEPRIALAILPERVRVVRATGLPPAPTARLNADDVEDRVTGYRLVYRVETAERHPRRELITLVDASSGAIVKLEEAGAHDSFDYTATGTARTFFSGTVTIDTSGPSPHGDVFQLLDPGRGGSTVWDQATDSGNAMGDNNNIWGDGQTFTSVSSRETAAVDAYFGVEVAWNMFKHVLNWNGVDGNGLLIHVGVHTQDQFNDGLFSGWDHDIYLGDSNMRGGTMCSLDLVGHEYGHAVTYRTAGLPESGEGGGLNEGNSDIWGAISRIYFVKAVDQSKAPTSPRVPDTTPAERDEMWTHDFDLRGEERPLFDPKVKFWSASIGDLDAHQALGPISRMFYFLAQGADPHVTDRSWSSSLLWGMTGLGNDTAARIWFRALSVYLQSGDGYAQARSRTIDAVRDLFGEFGPEEKAVRNAFAGVDVGDPAVNAPAPPTAITEVEPNNSESEAQVLTFPTTTPIPGLRKLIVFGGGTDKDDFRITVPCGVSIGARLQPVGDYDLAIFQAGSSTPFPGASSSNGPDTDEVVSLPSTAGCTGSTTFFVRVLFQSPPLFIPPQYILHLDRQS